ncbi:MAG: hypothetical protein R3F48_08300 [Candidatus Zixiibacteriota bacterium]
MGVLKREQVMPQKQTEQKPDKSLYISDERVDREGHAWKKQSIFIRNEHLGKMKVMSHFSKKSVQDIVDSALADYLKNHFDDSAAMQEMIKKSGNK